MNADRTGPEPDESVLARFAAVQDELLGRTPEHELEPSLDRVRRVMDLLGDPQRAFPVIHVGGTNGKTTTSRVIETLLGELGLTTGRFTSPHLHSLTERIAVGSEPLSLERFVEVYDEVLPYVRMVDAESQEGGGPAMTFFEVLVTMAYAAFADQPVDVAVVEVGMGGSWDATNVADGGVSVITPIGLDHQHFLGASIHEIAAEKAGIVKPGAIAVVASQPFPEAERVLQARAVDVGARVATEGTDFVVTGREVAVGGQLVAVSGLAGEYRDLFVPLWGPFQAQNVACAIAAVEAFVGAGTQPLDEATVRAALAEVTSPGRLEIVRRSPTVIVDAAHNPAGIEALVAGIRESFVFTTLVGVVSIMADKDAAEMLELLDGLLDHVVVTRNHSPRAMAASDLGAVAAAIFGEHRVTVVEALPDAIDVAAGLADDGGMSGAVLATGSVMTAADVRELLRAGR